MMAALASVRMTDCIDESKCLTMVVEVRRFLRPLNSSSCLGDQTQMILQSRMRSLVLADARSGRYVPS